MVAVQRLMPPKVIAVDVDGTLLVDGRINAALLNRLYVLKGRGYSLMLWSARGAAHAQRVAATDGVIGLFDVVCSKPGYIIDDKGWTWIKYTRVWRCDDDSGGAVDEG